MKSILLTLSLLQCLQGLGQNNFMSGIGASVQDSTSQFYYPVLLDKVQKEPQNLTIEDCKHLYYGQIFQEGDKSLTLTIPGRKEFDRLIMTSKCKKAIKVGLNILQDHPVELTTLLNTKSCMNIMGQEDSDFYLEHRLKRTMDAILSTGDGRTLKTAIQIVNLDDDLVIKRILNIMGGSEQLMFKNERSYSVWTRGTQTLFFEDILIEKE